MCIRDRVDTVETCYREAGEAIFENAADGQHLRFNEKFQCKTCGLEFAQPEPILFSFNSPFGACPRCQGFGNTIDFDPNLILPDRSRTLAQGAIAPWTTPKYRPFHGEMIPGNERSLARIKQIQDMGFTAAKIDIDDAADPSRFDRVNWTANNDEIDHMLAKIAFTRENYPKDCLLYTSRCV